MGMLSPSAKGAIPSGPGRRAESSRILTVSFGLCPRRGGKGYSSEPVTQRRPLASKAMLIGFLTFGSAATSWMTKPGGT